MRFPLAVFLPIAVLLAACATRKSASEPAPMTVNATGVVGEASATRTEAVRATIEAVDFATRSLTVKGEDGSRETFQVSPSVKRFSELAKGDVITLEVRQGLLLEYLRPGAPPVEPQAVTVGGVAEANAPPALEAGTGVQATVVIVKIASKARVVTIQAPDGNQYRVGAGPNIPLEKLKVGDRLVATYVEAVAVSVEKAGKKL